jgi:hypothetical protein
LAPLWDVPGVTWVSLQRGPDGLTVAPDPRVEAGHDATTWVDTAAIMAGLSGVVAVDTGVAHLAASMGIPTVLMVPSPAEWRWGHVSTRSIWYPSLTIVRQTGIADWPSAIAQAVPLVRP